MNSHPQYNLVKIKVALEVLRHAESKSDLDFEGFPELCPYHKQSKMQSIVKNESEKE